MKVFQISNKFCYWDATRQFPTLASTAGKFAPDIVFVETPDYVFEGWGYDEAQVGDARFIKPTPPDGWAYNDENGTFYLDTSECKEERYNALSVQYIRARYSQNDEYKILREKLAYDTPEVNTAFETYNDYVEACKTRACEEVYGGGQ